MIRLLLLSLLWMPSVWAAEVVVCDPSHPNVANAVTRAPKSVGNVKALRGRTGFLIWEAPHNGTPPDQAARNNSTCS